MNQSFFVKTYGCQMNDYDSEKIDELLLHSGFTKAFNFEKSDVAILNTCHIRKKASEKFYSDLGRLSIFKKNKEKIGKKMKIVVMGCVAQAEGEEVLKRNNSVDYVIGPQNIHVIPNLLKKSEPEKIHTDFLVKEKFQSIPLSNSKNISRLITIQEGCDKFCSFCVVPYTRGSEYSRPVENIFLEAKNLEKKGAVELTLLGQNVSAYKSSVYENQREKKVFLSHLCNILSSLPKIKRIRYLTSHPNDITDSLIEEHKNNKKLMPFLHLPIQSGSNKILKKMNRKHSKNDYLKLISKIRKQKPEMAFSSDFIIGYPGESDNDFEETLDLIEKVSFASSYSFKYSPRPGTPAALKNEIIEEKKLDLRLKKAQELLVNQQNKFNELFIDKVVEVLIESHAKKYNQYVGRTKYLQPVHVFSEKNIIGETLKIKLEGLTSFSFHGKVMEP